MSEYPSEVTLKRGTNGKWSCPIKNCTYSLGNIANLMRNHVRCHFKHLNWFNCKHCVFSPLLLDNLKKHLANQHRVQEAKKGIDYEENKELLAKETRLIESANKIKPEADELNLPFKCDQCTKQCSRDFDLQRHKTRKHQQKKEYECVSCNYAAVTLHEVFKHSAVAHLFFKYTSEKAATAEQKSKLDQCYRMKSDKNSTEKPTTKSFFTAKPIDFTKAKQIELKFMKQVSQAKLNTTKVKGKANKLLRSFVYILLDPRFLPTEEDDFIFSPTKFLQFVAALFYVGRGTSVDRPYMHERKDGEHAKCDKIDEINKAGYNITVFPFFSGLSPVDASAREAILISTLGLACLTNEYAGHLPKEIQLEPEEIHLLGNYWLYRVYRAFVHVGVKRPFLNDDECHHKSSENHGPEQQSRSSKTKKSSSSTSKSSLVRSSEISDPNELLKQKTVKKMRSSTKNKQQNSGEGKSSEGYKSPSKSGKSVEDGGSGGSSTKLAETMRVKSLTSSFSSSLPKRTSTVIVDYRSKEAAAVAVDIDSGELEYKKQKIKSKAVDKSCRSDKQQRQSHHSSQVESQLAPSSSSAGRSSNITTSYSNVIDEMESLFEKDDLELPFLKTHRAALLPSKQ